LERSPGSRSSGTSKVARIVKTEKLAELRSRCKITSVLASRAGETRRQEVE
jgi:hypothetical protein